MSKKQNKRKGGDRQTHTGIIEFLPRPESLNEIKIINTELIPLEIIARLKCFQCG